MHDTLSVLHEDNHLLAIDKPAGLPSQPDDSGDPAAADLARDYLRRRCHKPGNIYLAPVHRLDRPVSGALLLAKTDKAAGRLSEQFRARQTGKIYWAIVELLRPPPPPGTWRLTGAINDGERRGVRVAGADLRIVQAEAETESRAAFPPSSSPAPSASTPPARGKWRAAELELSVKRIWRCGEFGAGRAADRSGAAQSGRRAWLRIRLLTGVKHQIRAQLAERGWPVAGDFRYGAGGGRANPAPVAGGRAIALHSRELRIIHPTRKTPLAITAPPPLHWLEMLPPEHDAPTPF